MMLMRRLRHLIISRRALFGPALRVRDELRRRADRRAARARHPDVRIVSGSDISGESFSQYGQDRFILDYIGTRCPAGIFVDIGCNHPIRNSNSVLFERSGWSGVAIDPIRAYEAEWRESRKTPFVRAAVANEASEREFVEFDNNEGWESVLSAFADYVSPAHVDAMPHQRFMVRCGPISTLVPWLGRIDLAMIDVEGAELIVLDGLEFERYRPSWLLIENNLVVGGDEKIRDYLAGRGYALKARIGETDDFYELDGEIAAAA